MADSHKTPNMYPSLIATPLIAAPLDVPLIATSLSAAPFSDQQHFRLNKINEIKDYFAAEIKERELMSKIFSKYITFLTILISNNW